jgi:hypothetical protein
MISRARLGVMMGIACFCFGCKGAGGLFKVAGVVAVTAVRVAAVVAASAPSGGGGGGGDRGVVYAPAAVTDCVELPPAPELPDDEVAVRMLSCHGTVMVQDAETGIWRLHR